MKTIHKLWQVYSPLFHIGVWLFFAGMAWANVSAQTERIDRLEMAGVKRQEAIETIKQDLNTIKESTRWIEKYLGRRQ